MEFWRYYRIIRRRRWLILTGMAVCVGMVAFFNYTTIQMYTGRTTVMEPSGSGMSQDKIPLYPEPYLQLDVQLRLSNLGSIASSQRVMQNAALTLSDLGMKFSAADILKHTSVSPVRDTSQLAIEVTLEDPNDAKIAADVIAAEFKKVYGELNNSAVRESREFIEAQLETTRKAMVKAQNDLRSYKEKSGVVVLESQANAAIQRLVAAKGEIAQAQASSDAADNAASRLQSEIAKMPAYYTSGRNWARDPIWQELMNRLTFLEMEKANHPTWGKKNPGMIALERQVAEVKGRLREVSEKFEQGSSEAANPNRQGAMDQWVRQQVESVSQKAKLNVMRGVEQEALADLRSLPAEEAKLAELQAEVLAASNTYRLMRDKVDEARIKEQQAKNEVAIKTIDPAYVFAVDQKRSLKVVLALLLSPLLGIGIALLLHYADNTIKTVTEAEKLLGVPVYSAVPGARAHSLVRQKCPEIMGVAYQMLTSHLWIASQNMGVNSVVMVSAEPDVGRSVTASNLAVALTREGARVVLVDADLRQPSQHLIFGVDSKVGLTNLLSGAASIEDVLVPTRVQGLLLVPAGPIPENPVKLLRSAEMKEFVEQIAEAADFVVYDTPAGIAFPDAALISSYVGNTIVVHAAGRVPRGSEAEFKARLESVGARILGAVLNKVRREDSSGFFHYRRSYEGIDVPVLSGGKKALKGKP